MPTLEATLNRLAVTFTARDIMTGNLDLVCGANERDAAKKLDANPDFDVIPIQRDGRLTGYFQRENRSTKRRKPATRSMAHAPVVSALRAQVGKRSAKDVRARN
jgi:hypothetical protein